MFKPTCMPLFWSCFLFGFSAYVFAELPTAGSWAPIGPEGGNVSRLALDPFGSNLVLAGAGGGGLYRSDDGGQSWRLVGNGLPTGGSLIEPYADPNLQNAFYALTSQTGRLYRSTDGGENWAEVAAQFSGGGTFLAVDATNPGTVVVGTSGGTDGVQYTTDGGTSWSQIDGQNGGLAISGFMTDVLVDNADSNIVYVSTQSAGVFRGIQVGGQWTFASMNTGFGSTNVSDLAQGVGGKLIAAAGGRPYHYDTTSSQWAISSSFGTGILGVAFDPGTAQPETAIYTIGNDGIGQGLLGGTETLLFAPLATSVDIVVDSAATLFLVSTSGQGVYRSTDGLTWAASNNGLLAMSTRSVLVDLGQQGHILATSLNIGLLQSFNSGGSWQPTSGGLRQDQPVTLLTTSPFNNQTLFAQQGGSIFMSTDSGANWLDLDMLGALSGSIRGLVLDSSNPDLIYVASTVGFWVGDISAPAAPIWTSQATGYPASGIFSQGANALVRDSSNGDFYINSFGGGMFRGFQNGPGIQWEDLPSPLAGNDFGLSIAIDNTETFIYGFNSFGYLLRVDLSVIPEAVRVFHDIPDSPATLFSAGGTSLLISSTRQGGAYSSADNGETWQMLGSNSPGSELAQFVQDPHNASTYFAATLTHGIMRLTDVLFSDGFE